jgi:hypothetical protein
MCSNPSPHSQKERDAKGNIQSSSPAASRCKCFPHVMQCRSKTKAKGNFYIEFQTSPPGLSSAYQNVQTKIIQKNTTDHRKRPKKKRHTNTHTLSLSYKKKSSKSRMNELQGVAEFDEKEQFEKRKKLTDSKR